VLLGDVLTTTATLTVAVVAMSITPVGRLVKLLHALVAPDVDP
jgi:hypothetical protein